MDLDEMFGVFGGDDKKKDLSPSKKGKRRRDEKSQPVTPKVSHEVAAAATAEQVSAAALVAQREQDQLLEKKRAKKLKKADNTKLELKPLSNGIQKHIEETSECVHEVAVPSGQNYVPLDSREKIDRPPAKEYPFVLDPFQRQAVKCLENYESVLVSAHTSAGKTVVAEYAIAMSLRDKQRVIYTSPIKALSNQKFRELQAEFQDVGLMTGDVTINPSASCLVMTTEILRSMLYRGSEVMREVGWVIYDEIHYMRDKERGVVWEESIILLPDNVHYVFLSATIPNALQFARWVCHLHTQPCHVVYTEYRPTPLQHYMYPSGSEGLYLVVDDTGTFLDDNFKSAMVTLNDAPAPGSKDQKGRRGGTKGPSNCVKVVQTIAENNLFPAIVFSFSKKDCESHAKAVSKFDLNTDEEKEFVREIFDNAVDSLTDEDKQLPMITNLLPLLLKGIGIHHGGLLPLMKEVIEILFGEGLVKVLFATETFAMGLNMPAKTVVFTATKKFDGQTFRTVTGGEYIQMSGRAGRRGLDDRGIVIMMVDEKIESNEAKDLLKGKADTLFSAFHLGYNMVLNLLRVEEINPEYMLQRSFHQFQNNEALPSIELKLKNLKRDYKSIEIEDEENAMDYFNMRQSLATLKIDMKAIANQPKYLIRFLNPGRLIEMRNGWGWGVVVNYQKKKAAAKGKIASGAMKEGHILELLIPVDEHAPKGTPQPAPVGVLNPDLQVIPFEVDLVEQVSTVRITMPKTLKNKDSRISVGKQIRTLKERFKQNGLPILDPIKDLKIDSDELKEVVSKIQSLEKRMFSHKMSSKKNVDDIVALCQKKHEVGEEVKSVKKELKKAQSILQLDELKCRKRVLRRLNFASDDDVVELKGRVACYISSGDTLLMTEMIFTGVFNELSVNQVVSLLSCFIFEERSDTKARLKEELAGPLRLMHDSARRIAKTCIECKMELDEEEYVDSFRADLMDVVSSWCGGAKFGDIAKMTDVYEGSIVRAMRRLEELLRQLCLAAKSIGNTELENKFAEGITKIKRDIIFAQSLYL